MEPAAADALEGDDLFAQLVQDDANEPPPPAADAADDPEPIETLVEDDAAASSSADRFSSGLQALTEAAHMMPQPAPPVRAHPYARAAGVPVRLGEAAPALVRTTDTPKWRCGMRLCNACGLRYTKRAAPRRAVRRRAAGGMPGGMPVMGGGGRRRAR